MRVLPIVFLGMVVQTATAAAQAAGAFVATGQRRRQEMQSVTRRLAAVVHPALSFLLAWGVASHPSMVMAQSSGTFRTAGNMTVARSGHSATLLPDGRVLIAGGVRERAFGGFELILTTAELYDPSNGAFTTTGSMTTARESHSATLLPDGRVLIAGGKSGQNNLLKSAELYDPSTGTFTPTSDMVAAQRCQGATLLGSGKVLLAGGLADAAELYDPATGTFSATGRYAAWPGDFNTCERGISTLRADGKVLIVWEGPAPGAPRGGIAAEVYDPDSGAFTVTGKAIALSRNDGVPTATLLTNGRILVAGGAGVHLSPTTAELYDSSTEIFSGTGDMITGHVYHTATLLPDGTVLMAGSWLFPGALANTELYRPDSGSFTASANMITARGGGHTATLLNTGQVLVAGGFGAAINGITATAEIYHPVVLVPAPRLFSLSGDGRGQGAIWRAATGEIASPASRAVAGEVLSMYTTTLADGGRIPPQVAVGGRLAEILFFGAAPGYTGYFQVNFRVPSGIAPGPAAPVRLTYISRATNEVTIGVR
jgi:uncharacterized protein (TIGR03437 family)